VRMCSRGRTPGHRDGSGLAVAGRFTIRNTSCYEDAEVRALVKFAMSEVDVRGVCVNVKNSQHPMRGMAYEGVPYISNAPVQAEYLITIGIGSPERFPRVHDRKMRGAPSHELADWREALVAVAAHEAKHIEQFRENKRRSEVACENFEAYMLRRYREEMI